MRIIQTDTILIYISMLTNDCQKTGAHFFLIVQQRVSEAAFQISAPDQNVAVQGIQPERCLEGAVVRR